MSLSLRGKSRSKEGCAIAASMILSLVVMLSPDTARAQAINPTPQSVIVVPGAAADKLAEANRQESPAERLKILREAEPLFADPALKYVVLYPELVEAYAALGEMDNAASLVDQMSHEGAPSLALADAHISLARGYMAKNQYDAAAQQLDPTLQSLRNSVAAKTSLARFSVHSLMSALELEGEVLVAQHDSQRALAIFGELEELRVSRKMEPSARIVAETARAYAVGGRQEDAIQSYAKSYCMAEHKVNAIHRHTEVAGQAASAGYSQELAEQETLLAKVKDEMLPLWGAREGKQSLDSFLDEKLKDYDRELLAEALRTAATKKPAPDFTLSTITGTKLKLSDLRGKVVLLNFWDTSCKPCRAEYPHLQKIQDEFRDKGVTILMINLDDDRSTVKPFADKYSFTAQVLFKDNAIQNAYGVGLIPHTVIVDPSGMIRFDEVGFTLDTPDVFRAEINSLLAAKDSTSHAPGK